MSRLKRKNETGEKDLKKQKTELDTCHYVEYEPVESKNLSLKPSSKDCKETNYEDCVCPVTDQNDDQLNDNGFLLIGEHENQVSEGGEVDLHKHKKNCKKNPGHPEFIPIESFSLKHLPKGLHDSDLYEVIKAIADLTVKLSVNMTSPDRPEFWPNTKIPYHLSNLRGKKILRTGTGWVCSVEKYTYEDKKDDKEEEEETNHEDDSDEEDENDEIDVGDEDNIEDKDNEEDNEYDIYEHEVEDENRPCPCEKCAASDKPSKVWWKIKMNTAAHVVIDDIEASHTTLRFFYDREDSEVVILKDKVCVYQVDIERDRCWFTCVTCDKNVGNKLKKMMKHFEHVWEKVNNKYIKSRDIHKLNFIVSHPHGCSKQVSVGQWKDKVQILNGWTKFTYTTCTCPGSSGANVHCVGFNGWLNEHVHSGSFKSGLNYSGVNFVL